MATTMYKMAIVYSLDLAPKGLTDLLSQIGASGTLVFTNAREITIEQTVPFIPDQVILQCYADILKGTVFGDFSVEDAHFVGYKYLEPITMDG